MKLQFIGTGGGFADIENFNGGGFGNSNMLFLADNGQRLLLDAGHTAPYILRRMGINPNQSDIDGIYISHLHADHAGSLAWMALYNYFTRVFSPSGDKLENRLKLYVHNSLIDELWNHIRAALDTIQGRSVDIDTFFDVHSIMDDGSFHWNGYKFDTIQTLHVVSNRKFMNSFGLMVYNEENPTNRTFITTDTQFTYPCPLQVFYDQADLIFHDCETKFKSGVHAFFNDMADKIDEKTKSKIWLYHHNKVEDDMRGFAGFVEQFQTFDI